MPTLDPVQVVFSVGGLAEVTSAFRSVEGAMARLEREQRSTSERAAKAQVAAMKSASVESAKAAEALTKKTEAEEKKRTDAAGREDKKRTDAEKRSHEQAVAYVASIRQRYFAQQQKNEEKATSQSAREEKKRADTMKTEHDKAVAHVQGIRQRYFAQLQREAETAEKKALSAATSASNLAAKEKAKDLAHVASIRRRYFDEQQRDEERATQVAAREEAKRTREHERALSHVQGIRRRYMLQEQREAQSAASRARQKTQGMVGGAVSAAGGAISSVASKAMMLGTAALTLGGGAGVTDALHKGMQIEQGAIALANSAYQPGVNERVDPKLLEADVMRVQASTNIDGRELMKGLQSYVAKTGNLESGRTNLEWLAKASKATGTSFDDMTSMAGMIRAQNADMTPEQMRATILGVIGQGKAGAVEISDLARVAARTTATAGLYQGDQGENQRKLLALSQLAIKTTGSADEAGTAVASFGRNLASRRDKIAKDFGQDFADSLVDKQGRVADPAQAIAAIFEKTKGDVGQMGEGAGHIGLGREALQLMYAVAPTYNKAEANQQGSGAQAVRDEITRSMAASYGQGDLDKEFANVMSANAEKLSAAFNKLEETVRIKVQPYLDKFADKLPELTPKIDAVIENLAKLAGWVMENPLKAAFAVLAGEMVAAAVRSIVVAKMGESITAAITSVIMAAKAALGVGSATEGAAESALANGAAGAGTGAVVQSAKTASSAAPTAGKVTTAGRVAGAVKVAGAMAVGAMIAQSLGRENLLGKGWQDKMLVDQVGDADPSTKEGQERIERVRAVIQRDISAAREAKGEQTAGGWVHDKADPAGAAGRKAESDAAFDKVIKQLTDQLEVLTGKLKKSNAQLPDNLIASSAQRGESMSSSARGGADE